MGINTRLISYSTHSNQAARCSHSAGLGPAASSHSGATKRHATPRSSHLALLGRVPQLPTPAAKHRAFTGRSRRCAPTARNGDWPPAGAGGRRQDHGRFAPSKSRSRREELRRPPSVRCCVSRWSVNSHLGLFVQVRLAAEAWCDSLHAVSGLLRARKAAIVCHHAIDAGGSVSDDWKSLLRHSGGHGDRARGCRATSAAQIRVQGSRRDSRSTAFVPRRLATPAARATRYASARAWRHRHCRENFLRIPGLCCGP